MLLITLSESFIWSLAVGVDFFPLLEPTQLCTKVNS